MEFQGTTAVIDCLLSEGYEVSVGYVQWLLRDRIIPAPRKGPGGVFLWSEREIAALRRELARRGRGPEDASRTPFGRD